MDLWSANSGALGMVRVRQARFDLLLFVARHEVRHARVRSGEAGEAR